MPTFSFCTAIRESVDNFSLVLKAEHILDAGTPSEHVLKRGRLPDNMSVTLRSDLVFTMSGLLNGAKITPAVMQQSAVAHYTCRYLKANSGELGFSSVSEVYIDDDGHAKFSVISSRSLRSRLQPEDVHLRSIHLVYACRCAANDEEELNGNIFTGHAYLPSLSALDRVLEKFASYHLVKRYPLIFGPWRARLDTESVMLVPLFRSVTNIAGRSTNTMFRKEFRRLRETLERQHLSTSTSALLALHEYIQQSNSEMYQSDACKSVDILGDETEVDFLCQAMEHVFRLGVKPKRFKGVRFTSAIEDTNVDAQLDLDLDHDFIVDSQDSSEDILHHEETHLLDSLDILRANDDLEFSGEEDDGSVADDDSWPWSSPYLDNSQLQSVSPSNLYATSTSWKPSRSSSPEYQALFQLDDIDGVVETGFEACLFFMDREDTALPFLDDDDYPDRGRSASDQECYSSSSTPSSGVALLGLASGTQDNSERFGFLPASNSSERSAHFCDLALGLASYPFHDNLPEDIPDLCSGSRSPSFELNSRESSPSERRRIYPVLRIDASPRVCSEAILSYSRPASPAVSMEMNSDCRVQGKNVVRMPEMALQYYDEEEGFFMME